MGNPTTGKKKSKKARKKGRMIIFGIEIVVLLILLTGIFVFAKLNKIKKDENFKTEDLVRNDEVKKEDTAGFTTIALFGLDSRDVEDLGEGVNSDTIMIASINNKTKEVKLASVYRDTYLKIPDEDYNKANSAYCVGGPEKAISMLNMNLDLAIEDYVTINFKALIEVIDALGGIEIDVTEEEVDYINGYMVETSEITGAESPNITSAGTQTLTGLQATAYCRIRYTTGDDYKRTERQRLVLSKIAEKVKQSDPATLNKVADSVLGDISTSLESTTILKMVADAISYELGETTGFPFTKTTNPDYEPASDAVYVCGLEYNVSQLHKFLYGEENYQVSSTVKEISDYIIEQTGAETEYIEEDATTGSSTGTTTDSSTDSNSESTTDSSTEGTDY